MKLKGEYVIIMAVLIIFTDFYWKPQNIWVQILALIITTIWTGVLCYDLYKRFTRKGKRNRGNSHC